MPSSLSALRALPPHAVDAGLAVLLLVGTSVEIAFSDGPSGDRLAALGPAAVMTAGLLLRRRVPILALVPVAVALLSLNALSDTVWDDVNVIYIGFPIAVYAMATREDEGRLLAGIGLALLGVLAIAVAEDAYHPSGLLVEALLAGPVLFVAAPVLAGRALRQRLGLNDALAEKAVLIETGRRAAAEEAVIAERAHIASELHDLVAHALGAMTVQASAARRLSGRDQERAAGAFAAVESTGRDALAELRVLLDVLRDDDGDGAPVPQPTLRDLPALVARADRHGLAVSVSTEGLEPERLPAGATLAAYRVVQDALRAARLDAAAGHAHVTVRYRPDAIEVEVTDDGDQSTERRLVGLRERVRLFGGEVSAERDGLRARLPLEAT